MTFKTSKYLANIVKRAKRICENKPTFAKRVKCAKRLARNLALQEATFMRREKAKYRRK